jgi:hypothetical protein
VSHVFGELFKMMTGINLVHVPYRGGYVSDLLSGQVQVVFGTISSCIQTSGQERACRRRIDAPGSRLMHRSKQHLLFDHLVGAGEQGRWDFEAERLGSD